MADATSSNSSATSASQTVRSSSRSATSVYRSWASASASRPNEAVQRRTRVYEALTKYIHASGGHVVSVPGASVMRIEIPQVSCLPVSLADLGYNAIPIGGSTRVTGSGIVAVEVFEIVLS